MKIGVLVDVAIPGGVQQAAINEVKNLKLLGHQAKLIVLVKQGQTSEFVRISRNIETQFLSDSLPRIFQPKYKLPVFSFFSLNHILSPLFAPKIFKKRDLDLIISHNTTTTLTALSLKKFCSIPYIAIIHDPSSYILKVAYSKTFLKYLFFLIGPIITLLEGLTIRHALYTAIDSKLHFQFIKKIYKVEPKIIPLGVKPQLKPNFKRGDQILALSRWQKEKNPDLILQIIQKIPGSKLLIVGIWTNSKDLAKFKSNIKQFGLTTRVKIKTHYQESELKQLTSQARLFIHPIQEAFGMGALEAASFGLPIVMTKSSGVASLFENKKEGLFADSDSLENFLPLVQKLIKHKNLASKIGQAAYLKISQNYTWQIHTQKLLNQAQNLLDRPKMSVLELGHLSSIAVSGGDKLFKQLLPYLNLDYSLEVVIPDLAKAHWQSYLKSNSEIKVRVLKPDLLVGKNKFFIFLNYLYRIYQTSLLLNQTKPNLVYSSTNTFVDVFPGFIYKQLNQDRIWVAYVLHLFPSVINRPGNFFSNLFSNILQNLSLNLIRKSANKVLALNSNLEDQLIQNNFEKNKTFLLGAGIDLNFISTHHVKKNYSYTGVFIGRMHQTKGIFDLPNIWSKVAAVYPSSKLAIIGETQPNLLKQLKKTINQYNLDKNIDILGFIPESQKLDILKSSEIFLFADYEAGFGLAIAEAMACGLAVIGYDLPVLGSVFKKGYIKVPLGNMDKFSEKIVKILRDKKLKQRLKTEAKMESQKFGIENIANQFSQLLEA